jgi:hypothetical protein
MRLVTTANHVAEKLRWLEGVVIGTNKRVDEYNKRLRAESARKLTLLDEETIRKDISSWQVSRVRV